MISPVGYVNFLHQDDGRVQHVADAVAAGFNINRATLLQKVAAHQRSLSRHTPSCGSSPGQCSGGPVGDLIFTSSVLLGFVAVLRTRRDSPSQVGACPLVCSLFASCHFYAFH